MRKRKSFTLIELLVAVGIVVIIAGLVIVSVFHARAQSRDLKRISDLEAISSAVEMYKAAKGEYPSMSIIGTEPPANIDDSSWILSNSDNWNSLQNNLGFYLSVLPKDPKNSQTPYYFWSNKTSYKIMARLEGDDQRMAGDNGTLSDWYEIFYIGAVGNNGQTEPSCTSPNQGIGAHLVISEVYYQKVANPSNDQTALKYQWIEIYNPSDQAIDLYDYTLRIHYGISYIDRNLRTHNLNSAAHVLIEPGEFLMVDMSGTVWQVWSNYVGGITRSLDLGFDVGIDLFNLNYATTTVSLINNTNGATQDQVSWTRNNVSPGSSLQRIDANCDTDANSDWEEQPQPNPGRQ